MRGFFTAAQTRSKTRPSGKTQSCSACGLYKDVLNPIIKPYGEFKSGIINVGESPGKTEDMKALPWQGEVGIYLQSVYRDFGLDLFEDCMNINSINCRPTDKHGNNREPTNHEITCCRSIVLPEIYDRGAKIIILFGGSAVSSLIGDRWRKDLGGITKWRGWTIPDRDLNAWVCPVFHPSYVNRSDKEVETIWLKDLERALGMVNVPLPKVQNEEKQVKVLEKDDDISDALRHLKMGAFPPDKTLLFFDLETTGLKPHADGHQIICMSFCVEPGIVYSFMTPTRRSLLEQIQGLLQSDLPKAAANMKFEHVWIQNIFGYEVRNWQWDTMQAAHVLDNRPGITSLKFQVYVRFGVIDYDSHIEGYTKAVNDKSANAVNRLPELIKSRVGKEALLKYCGLDTLYGYNLAMLQIGEMGFELANNALI